MPETDARDWDAIDAWAKEVSEAFALSRAPSPPEKPRERRRDEVGQRVEVVAALEHRGDPRREARARRASSSKSPVESSSCASGSSACASNPAETSSSSGSNAAIAALGPLERGEEAVVAGAGGERQVEQRLALLLGPPVPG